MIHSVHFILLDDIKDLFIIYDSEDGRGIDTNTVRRDGQATKGMDLGLLIKGQICVNTDIQDNIVFGYIRHRYRRSKSFIIPKLRTFRAQGLGRLARLVKGISSNGVLDSRLVTLGDNGGEGVQDVPSRSMFRGVSNIRYSHDMDVNGFINMGRSYRHSTNVRITREVRASILTNNVQDFYKDMGVDYITNDGHTNIIDRIKGNFDKKVRDVTRSVVRSGDALVGRPKDA